MLAVRVVNYLSLFSGIGGLDLGLDRAGMTCVGQVEINPFCRAVLARHWPEVPRHDDVRTVPDWYAGLDPRPTVHLVAGGFPCQPFSVAGHKRGTADERWLWPAMAQVIAATRPDWVLWENVPGLLTLGLDVVHRDLVALGYRHRVGRASACALGAPHMRRRLFGVAHTAGVRWRVRHDPPGQGDVPSSARRAWWATEPPLGRVAHGLPRRVDALTALGGAVVPQIGEYLGRLIMTAHCPEED